MAWKVYWSMIIIHNCDYPGQIYIEHYSFIKINFNYFRVTRVTHYRINNDINIINNIKID
jgi:hypothetical protein